MFVAVDVYVTLFTLQGVKSLTRPAYITEKLAGFPVVTRSTPPVGNELGIQVAIPPS